MEKKSFDLKYEKFRSWTSSSWRRWCLKYVLGSIIPLFIPIFYKMDVIRNPLVSYLESDWNFIYKALSPAWVQWGIVIFIFCLWPIFSKIMDERLEKYKEDVIDNKKEMTSLLACISSVVKEKRSRFYDCSQKNDTDPSRIFSNITKPKQQMNKIAMCLKSYFETIFDEDSLECYLICIENKQLGRMEANTCGGSPQIDIECLKKNEVIKKCIDKKDMMIVENVKDSVRKNRFNNGEIGKIKSAICYPVSDGNKVSYLWVISSGNCTFKKDRQKLFHYVLKEFSERLILESYLLSMLEKVK